MNELDVISIKKGEVVLAGLVMALSAVISDQGVKYWVRSGMMPVELERLHSFAKFVFYENFGLIGNFVIPRIVLLVISVLILAWIVSKIKEMFLNEKYQFVFVLAIIGGGILSNLIDRIVYGSVLKWMLLFNTFAINLADVYIATMLVVYLFLSRTSNVEADSR